MVRVAWFVRRLGSQFQPTLTIDGVDIRFNACRTYREARTAAKSYAGTTRSNFAGSK